jgi:hypothetical protein
VPFDRSFLLSIILIIYNHAQYYHGKLFECKKEIEELIQVSDLSKVERFYLDIGTKENTESINDLTYINSNRRIYHLLKEKVQDCRFEIVEGAVHNELAWIERVPQIFGFLYK